MEDSSSGSCSPDLEDCILESKSNESLSVGYFPYEDSTDCEEEIIPCEDLTSEGSSCHSLPPVQGAWGTESVRRPMGRRNEIQENPENLGQEAITKDLDAHLDCDGEDSVGHQALSENDQIMDGCAQERISQTIGELDDPLTNTCAFLDNQRDDKDDDPVLTDSSQEEDLQPFRNLSPLLDLVSHQEHETCQDLPKCKPLENGVIQQFLEKTRSPEEDEIIEMETAETCTAENPSVSSELSKEGNGPLVEENTCCLNFWRIFHWLRKQVASFLPGRNRPDRAKEGSIWLALQRRHLVGGNRILPQESF
ncbi:hypothetical protein SUZIE_157780 [Sciurus carolinensis]|uniref:Uncharacterized protein n=1 Tax=Sciurus carolinensis TaxID=30640 RepID=A0AA41T1Z1_SCICA|nr:hypothetical protein [Sciurus carolinensis]